ncbi:UNVERIFIED_CONTAM: hypothetical protein HDU68_008961 [Siphonaria sp. JEL0065]|nr:hypothetical protein HDU68_008961 [Siphonaria sp. JEL0065]
MFDWFFQPRFYASNKLEGTTVVISGCMRSLFGVGGSSFRLMFLQIQGDTGFGHDTSLRLLELEINVCAGFYTDSGIKEMKHLVSTNTNKYKGKLTALKLDVTSDTSVTEFQRKVEALTPSGIYAIINNAGIAHALPIEILPMKQHRHIMEVNYFGVLRFIRAFTPSLRKFSLNQKATVPNKQDRVSPRIITIGSIASRFCVPVFSAYTASKHAVKALTDVARMEVAQFGIQATVIEPYFATTPIITNDRTLELVDLYEKTSQELKDAYGVPSIDELKMIKARAVGDPLTMKPSFVIGIIVDSVRRKYLADQYLVGVMAYIMVALQFLVPSWILDGILQAEVKNQIGRNKNKYI